MRLTSLCDYLTSPSSLYLLVGAALDLVTKLLTLFTWKLIGGHCCWALLAYKILTLHSYQKWNSCLTDVLGLNFRVVTYVQLLNLLYPASTINFPPHKIVHQLLVFIASWYLMYEILSGQCSRSGDSMFKFFLLGFCICDNGSGYCSL